LETEKYKIEAFNYCDAGLCFQCGYSREGRPPPEYNDTQTSLEKYIDSFSVFTYPKKCKRGDNWIKLMKYRDNLESRYSFYRGSDLDFYAIKGNDEYIIEVKTNKGELEESQKKLMEYSKELGYIPLVIKVEVLSKVTEIKGL